MKADFSAFFQKYSKFDKKEDWLSLFFWICQEILVTLRPTLCVGKKTIKRYGKLARYSET